MPGPESRCCEKVAVSEGFYFKMLHVTQDVQQLQDLPADALVGVRTLGLRSPPESGGRPSSRTFSWVSQHLGTSSERVRSDEVSPFSCVDPFNALSRGDLQNEFGDA